MWITKIFFFLYDSAISPQSDIFTESLYVQRSTHPASLSWWVNRGISTTWHFSIGLTRPREFLWVFGLYKDHFFKVSLTPRACTLAILNAKAPCVSMPVTLYEAVCHSWRYKDKQCCLHTDSLSERTHYLVSSTVKKRRLEHNTTESKQNRVKVPL